MLVGRLTPRAHHVMEEASRIAVHYNHDFITIPDIMLAILTVPNANACVTMKHLHVDLQVVQKLILDKIVPNKEVLFVGNRILGPDASTIMMQAEVEATADGQRDIGTEHLLLGILFSKLGLVFNILQANLTYEQVKATIPLVRPDYGIFTITVELTDKEDVENFSRALHRLSDAYKKIGVTISRNF